MHDEFRKESFRDFLKCSFTVFRSGTPRNIAGRQWLQCPRECIECGSAASGSGSIGHHG
jgi:hypothetical protein